MHHHANTKNQIKICSETMYEKKHKLKKIEIENLISKIPSFLKFKSSKRKHLPRLLSLFKNDLEKRQPNLSSKLFLKEFKRGLNSY